MNKKPKLFLTCLVLLCTFSIFAEYEWNGVCGNTGEEICDTPNAQNIRKWDNANAESLDRESISKKHTPILTAQYADIDYHEGRVWFVDGWGETLDEDENKINACTHLNTSEEKKDLHCISSEGWGLDDLGEINPY